MHHRMNIGLLRKDFGNYLILDLSTGIMSLCYLYSLQLQYIYRYVLVCHTYLPASSAPSSRPHTVSYGVQVLVLHT